METQIFIPTPSEDLDAFIAKITSFCPDVVAFSIMTFQAYHAVEILRELKNRQPDLVAIAGGPHPTFEPEFFLNRGFDACVMGEGESAFGSLLKTLAVKKRFLPTPGVTYRSEDKLIKVMGTSRIDLDHLALPIRIPSLMDKKGYVGMAYPSPDITAWASICTVRGCPYDCYFCDSAAMWNRKVTSRSPKSVVEEMMLLHDKYGVDLFHFSDLDLAFNTEYIIKLCEEIIRVRKGFHWFCMARADTLGCSEVIDAIKQAGCTLVSLGVESTDDTMLRRIRKRVTYSQMEKNIDEIARSGIPISIFSTICFPWQTPDDIIAEGERLKDLNAHRIRVSIATPFPGTDFWRETRDRIHPESYHLFDTDHLVYNHDHLSSNEAIELQQNILRNFYLSPSYESRAVSFLKRFPHYSKTFQYYWKTLPFAREMRVFDEKLISGRCS